MVSERLSGRVEMMDLPGADPEEVARATEALSAAEDLLDALQELSPVLRRMLRNEESFDVEYWIRRLGALTEPPNEEDQEELF